MEWLKRLLTHKVSSPGALEDTRTVEEKEKDYRFEEVVASADPVNWVEKTSWRKFPIFNQDGSGSCVAQSLAKILGIHIWLKNGEFVPFSASHIYSRRSNKPGEGMIGVNAWDLARDGVTLEVLVPSQNLGEAEMNNPMIYPYEVEVGKVFKISNYVVMPHRDFELVASTIQKTKKPVMVWFQFTYDEWNRDIPILNSNRPTLRHSVVAVDYTLYQGKKYLVIEDSWGRFGRFDGQRLISEEFYNARNLFAAYGIGFKFDEVQSEKPRYTFARQLYYGMTQDRDVSALQDVLKYEGFFPSNTDSTGNFYGLTLSAVKKFQEKYGIEPIGRVGPQTVSKLNELYS